MKDHFLLILPTASSSLIGHFVMCLGVDFLGPSCLVFWGALGSVSEILCVLGCEFYFQKGLPQ